MLWNLFLEHKKTNLKRVIFFLFFSAFKKMHTFSTHCQLLHFFSFILDYISLEFFSRKAAKYFFRILCSEYSLLESVNVLYYGRTNSYQCLFLCKQALGYHSEYLFLKNFHIKNLSHWIFISPLAFIRFWHSFNIEIFLWL